MYSLSLKRRTYSCTASLKKGTHSCTARLKKGAGAIQVANYVTCLNIGSLAPGNHHEPLKFLFVFLFS